MGREWLFKPAMVLSAFLFSSVVKAFPLLQSARTPRELTTDELLHAGTAPVTTQRRPTSVFLIAGMMPQPVHLVADRAGAGHWAVAEARS